MLLSTILKYQRTINIYITQLVNYELTVWNLQERKLEQIIRYYDHSQAQVFLTNDNTKIAPGHYDDNLVVHKVESTKEIILTYISSIIIFQML